MPVSQPLGPPASRPVGKSRFSPAEIAAMLNRPSLGRVRNVAPRSERTYSGVVYDSKSEALYAFKLDAMKASGEIKGWSRQVPFPLEVNGKLICKFVVDFVVAEHEWDVIHEVKGWMTPEFRLKLKLFKALYPDMPYKVVRA